MEFIVIFSYLCYKQMSSFPDYVKKKKIPPTKDACCQVELQSKHLQRTYKSLKIGYYNGNTGTILTITIQIISL